MHHSAQLPKEALKELKENTTATPQPPEDDKLVTPAFALAWVINFTQYLAFYILVTTMALYAVKQFAASDAAAGFASSSFVVGATVARLFSGYLVDAFGRRRVLWISLAVVAVSSVGYLLEGSFWVLILVRMLHGLSYAIASTAVMTTAQRVIPPARRAEGTGFFALGNTLSTALGPAFGLFLVGQFSYRALFTTTIAVAVVSLVLGVLLGMTAGERAAAEEARGAERPSFHASDIADGRVVPIGVFMLIVGVSYSGVITFLMSYSEQRGTQTGASVFFLAYAAAMFISRFFLGRIQDERGDNAVVYFGVAMFILALVVLALAGNDALVIVAGVLSGLGYGTLMPASQAIAVRLVDASRLGTGISTLMLLVDVGVALGPIFLGTLISATGYSAMYLLLAGLVAVAGVFYFFVHGRRPQAKQGYADA